MPIEIWDNTFLVTDVSDIIVECINLIIEAGITDKKTIREFYDAYLHPYKMPTNDRELWDALCTEKILNLFQFDSLVGSQAIKKIKPHSMDELADANGLMRLMASKKGAETPMEKYVRYKNNIDLWYREMYEAGLTLKEQKVIEPYFKPSYGVPPSQEQMMMMLMDPDICNFSLADANTARKIVGKKLMSKIPDLKAQVLRQAKSPALGDYVWTYGLGPQMG